MRLLAVNSALVLVIILTSCGSSSPVTYFSLADGNKLLFVRPNSFDGSSFDVKVDLTYNSTAYVATICNISAFSSSVPIDKIKSLYFVNSNNTDTVRVEAVRKLFCEDDECRFTGTMPQEAFVRLVDLSSKSGISYTLMIDIEGSLYTERASGSFVDALRAVAKNLP